MSNTHSKRYSPSKSSTWIKCSLSTVLNISDDEDKNPASLFGEECHLLGATYILESLNLLSYDDGFIPSKELIPRLTYYDDKMHKLANDYANFVVSTYEFEKKKSKINPLICVEQKLMMDFDEDSCGTLDCGILSEGDGGTLTVIDLKTGRIPVKAFNDTENLINTQLGIYALYFYKYYNWYCNVKNVRLVIYQPSIDNINEYIFPIEELLKFETDILIPAVKRSNEEYLEAVINNGCKYCKGNDICPAYLKMKGSK